MSRAILVTFIGLTGAFGLVSTAEAAFNYPWCANYNMQNGPKNCGFTTLEQCQATVSGIGGYCAANPAYVAPAPSARRRPARQG